MAAAMPAQGSRRQSPMVHMSSAALLALTNSVFKGRNRGTIEVKVVGRPRWITPLTVNAAATIQGR
jgi:hypothetical protein